MTATTKLPATAPLSAKRLQWWISPALAAVTLLVFWPVTNAQFVSFDDPDFVTANPYVKAGLTAKSFKWVWHSVVAHNWHPITLLTHMADCQFFGLSPGGPHLVNLLWHIANALLLLNLLTRMTGAVWRSALVAALFALHPLHVESVAWIAERKDVLSAFFWLLTTWAYVRYAEELKFSRARFRFFYALALVFFALGLMSKPMLVTVPFALVLLDYWPLGRMRASAGEKDGRFPWRLVWEKIPFVMMSACLCVVTYSIQQQGGAVRNIESFSLPDRLGNALMSYVRYIAKMFWPEGLAGLYLRTHPWPLWQVGLAGLFLAAATAVVIAQRRRRPYLAVGWFWYLGTLTPVIGLVQVGMQTMADRYTYVPMIGLLVIFSWGAGELASRWRFEKIAAVAAAVLLAGCAVVTRGQIAYWHDSESLFKRMIDATPNNFVAHYDLGNLFAREGRTSEAIAQLTDATEEEPNYADAHNNLGGLLLAGQKYDGAIAEYRAAARVRPDFVHYFNLANALADSASAPQDGAQFAEAVAAYQQALRLNPGSSEAHRNLGLTWQAQGRESAARAELQEAARLNSVNIK